MNTKNLDRFFNNTLPEENYEFYMDRVVTLGKERQILQRKIWKSEEKLELLKKQMEDKVCLIEEDFYKCTLYSKYN